MIDTKTECCSSCGGSLLEGYEERDHGTDSLTGYIVSWYSGGKGVLKTHSGVISLSVVLMYVHENEDEIDLTREEFIALKHHLAQMRGYDLTPPADSEQGAVASKGDALWTLPEVKPPGRKKA